MSTANAYALLTRRAALAALPVLLPCLLVGAACSDARSEWPARGMNLLLVTVDTTRADVLSSQGGDPRTTPNLDRLAADGVRFANAYSATNVTKPAHLTLLTGKRLIEHQVFNNQVLIPPGTGGVQTVLKRAGYDTAAYVAAVQLGETTGWEGFDTIEGPPKGKSQRDGRRVVDGALRWLQERRSDAPFFLWAHLFDPHTIYDPPARLAREHYGDGDPRAFDGPLIGEEPWFEGWRYPSMKRWIAGVRDPAFAPALYAAEMEHADAQIGRLLDALEARGIAEETVVVVTADHGESLGEHGIYYDHAGLYEVSLRIPLMVRVPGLARGVVRDELVTQLDLVPTLSDLFGLGIAEKPTASGGRSLRPLLEGRADAFEPYEFLLHESAHNHLVAVRRGRWKLILPVFEEHRFLRAETLLFDLDADPDELVNVADEHPDVVAELAPLGQPWVALGQLEKGEMPRMDAAVLESLDDLGYAGD